ncbi:KAP family P-loop domain-containing protein [Roseovarius lutimaris]|uniref:KAP family P-loop domain-containing protein n=1 Tax=Roseovarius lutimaris TaxID=1005928 RepID=A0A1I5D4I0_9RHOB|nr:P-loop NTPase fold protein [Roseovarius lutimaris]SFN93781.1 KAP family P-loop domain-containing protein [Roseovarius lutimaris]
MNATLPPDPWNEDLPGYKAIGETFGNLIASIDEAKVISIEAGFGRGKTFFRKAWAEHLRQMGEIVVEIDAQQSDHSGDPVVSFVGALINMLPIEDKTARQDAFERGKKIAGLTARTVTRMLARSAADEVIDLVTDTAADQVEGISALENVVEDVGNGMSKLAGDLIAAQLASEQVRQKELPEQLSALHAALTKDSDTKRIVILIDELDRCHPEYAIALLEAMKLVFDHPGFVFCLMVNADYLENVAAKRFGSFVEGERYLDKFVDIRLQLPQTDETLKAATRHLAEQLPLEIPYGEDQEFSVARAAKLAGELAPISKLSMRQIKRVLLKVELALRCYRNEPLDCALLVFLAFKGASGLAPDGRELIAEGFLRRACLTPKVAEQFSEPLNYRSGREEQKREYEAKEFIQKNCQELLGLPEDRYKSPHLGNGRTYFEWVPVCVHLAEHYVPGHQAILDALHRLEVTEPPAA